MRTPAEKFDSFDENDELLKEEVRRRLADQGGLYSQSLFDITFTILEYILSDIRKKQKTFKIGVFTVFLVVSFVTFLKSVVDVAPVAFLKVGQDQGGSFDFMMQSDYSELQILGDIA